MVATNELPEGYTEFILQKLAELRARGTVLVNGVWQTKGRDRGVGQDWLPANQGEAA
jgi:hypothetical protein